MVEMGVSSLMMVGMEITGADNGGNGGKQLNDGGNEDNEADNGGNGGKQSMMIGMEIRSG